MPKELVPDQPDVEVLTAEEAAHLKAIDSGEFLCNMANCRFHGMRPFSREALEAAIRALKERFP